ncbi:sugar efflux transporter [Marinicellulosiphila megalodicopiae]|uniref:sugar efflux transporter n=1 Tax=Marinicellulosiphila megalodicopiae TaxID=2724896 RepID=UPI003BAE9632
MQRLQFFSKFGRAGNWLLLANVMTGSTFAFIIPVMSYFFLDQKGDGLNARPIDFLIYLVAITFFGTLCNQFMGRMADKGHSSKWIYIFSMACSAIATLLYANIESVYLIFVVGIVFVSLGSAAVPQILTVSRQYADQANIDVNQFNSVLRASFAAGWVIGSSFSYELIARTGFSGAFYGSSIVSVLAIIVALYALPNYHKSKEHRTNGKPDFVPLGFWLLMGVMIIGNVANSLYMLSIPLIITNELLLPESLPGKLFAIVAFLEIPFMLYSAKLAIRFNRYHLVMVSFLMGLIFYLGIYFATQSWQFMVLQIFNAAFIGIYAGLGISIVQDQLPKFVGFTSTMYTNSLRIGSTLGAVGIFVVGEFFTYQAAVLAALACMLLCLIGLILLQASPTQKSV